MMKASRTDWGPVAALLAAVVFGGWTGTAQQWEEITGLVPGRLTTDNIGPMATDGQHLYVLGRHGVFRSADGTSWEAVNSVADATYDLNQLGLRFVRFENGSLWVGDDPGSLEITEGATPLHRLSPGATVWQKSVLSGFPGPGIRASTTEDVAYDASTGRYFAASALGGVYRSDDGLQWEVARDGLPQLFGATVGDRVVARDGVALLSHIGAFGTGVYRSTDGGDTWHETAVPNGQLGTMIEHRGRILVALTGDTIFEDGVYFSDDLGVHWTHIPSLKGAWDLTSDGTLAFAALNAIYFSATDGVTWDALPTAGIEEGVIPLRIVHHGGHLFLLGWKNLSDPTPYLYRLDTASVDFTPSTQIAVPPAPVKTIVGRAERLEVLAGGANLRFQWLKDGAPLPGATGPVLEFAAAALSDSGLYAVEVTGDKGAVTSDPVNFEVVSPDPGVFDPTYDLTGATVGGQLLLLGDGSLISRHGSGFIRFGPEGGKLAEKVTLSGGNGFAPMRALVDAAERLVVHTQEGNQHQLRRFDAATLEADPVFPVLSLNNQITGMAELPGRGYVLVGWFTEIDGTAVPNLALVRYDGTVDTGYAAGFTVNGSLDHVLAARDGSLYLAGNFTTLDGQPRQNLAKLDGEGALDVSFAPGGLPGGYFPVRPWRELSDGRLLATVEQRRGSLALPFLIRTDGTRDPNYNPADLTFDKSVTDVALLTDGSALFAGGFKQFGAAVAAGYAKLTAEGTVDGGFKSDTGFHSIVPKDVDFVAYDPRGFAYLSSSGISGLFNPTFQGNPIAGSGPVRVFATAAELAILRQSVGGRVEQGGAITLFVRATGASALSYQWFKDGAPIAGATGPELALTDFSPADNGVYTVQVTNEAGVITSAPMRLFVVGVPEITAQPEGGEKETGQDHTFTVTATGAGTLGYQWLKNGTEIPGAVGATLELTDLQLADAGDYQVRVSNHLGAVLSDVATLTINEVTGRLVEGFSSPLNNVVRSVALFPDGTALLGGPFTIGAARQHDWFTRIGLDGRFLPGWSENPPGGIEGGIGVYHVTVLGNGQAIVAGQFTAAQGAPHPGLIRLNPDGLIDPDFTLPEGPNSVINAVGELPEGRLLVGGQFTRWGATRRLFLGRLNADGSWDETFALEPNDWVMALHTFPDGSALVAGRFRTLGDVNRSRIARLLPDGSLDPDFVPPTINNGVLDLAVDPLGRILVAGYFTVVGSEGRRGVARLNPDGSLDASFDPGNTWSNGATVVAAQLNGKVVAAGTAAYSLKRVLPDGTLDPWFGPNNTATDGPNAAVEDLAVTPEGVLWIAGGFTSPTRYLTALTTDKADLAILTPPADQVADLGADVTFEVRVYSVTPAAYQWFKDGQPIPGATGASLTLTGLTRSDGGDYSVTIQNATRTATSGTARLIVLAEPIITTHPTAVSVAEGAPARFEAAALGAGDLTYQWRHNQEPIPGATEPVLDLPAVGLDDAGCYDVRVINALGESVSHPAGLGVFGAVGSDDTAFQPDQPNSTVRAMTVLSDGRIAIGGDFTQVAGQPRSRLAVLDPQGKLLDLAENPVANFFVFALAPTPDGGFVAGAGDGARRYRADGALNGDFAPVDGQVHELAVLGDALFVGATVQSAVPGLRKFDLATGAEDTTYTAKANAVAGWAVEGLHVFPDGSALVGDKNGQLLRLQPDGSLDEDFHFNLSNIRGPINDIAVTDDGMIWLGGGFFTPYRSLLRLHPDGSWDNTQTNPGLNNLIYTLLPEGNDVLAGGAFSKSINGTQFVGVAKFSGTTGELDPLFGPPFTDISVWSLVRQGPGKVLAAGGPYSNPPRPLARIVTRFEGGFGIVCQPASVTVKAGESAAFSVGWTGGGNATYQWQKDGVELPDATGQTLRIESATADDAGNYTVRVTAGGETADSLPATLTVNGANGGDPLADFLSGYNLPPGQTGPYDNPEGDRLNNLQELAFGGHPLENDDDKLPAATTASAEGRTYPAVTFVRRAQSGADIAVAVSSNVGFSDELGATEAAVEPLGNGLERVTLRSNAPDDTHPAQFFRVRVTLP